MFIASERTFRREDDKSILYSKFLRILFRYRQSDGRISFADSDIKVERRLTHQFISALLAMGCSRESRVIKESYQWLINSMKYQSDIQEDDDDKTYFYSFDKIETAVDINDDIGFKYVNTAIPLVLKCYKSPLRLDLPSEYDNKIADYNGSTANLFDLLWLAKILLKANSNVSIAKEIVDRHISSSDITDTYKYVRDLAMLINLKCLCEKKQDLSSGSLLNTILSRFISEINQNMYVDLHEDCIQFLEEEKMNGFTVAVISENSGKWAKAIISTLYSIDNLSIIYSKSVRVRRFIDNAFDRLFGSLLKSIGDYQIAFESEYDQYMIASRSIITLARSDRLNTIGMLLPILAENIAERDAQDKEIERRKSREPYINAIKKWIEIKLDDENSQVIKSGFSGAYVARVKPEIIFPLGRDRSSVVFPKGSIILKSGYKKEIDRERRNYHEIPSSHKQCVATIPSASYEISEKRGVLEYLIIEDLSGFCTISEYIRRGMSRESIWRMTKSIIALLEMFYSMPSGKASTEWLFRDIYLRKMRLSMDYIEEYIAHSNINPEAYNKHYFELMSMISTLKTYSSNFTFSTRVMHGDLHTRNIMYNEKSEESKLIDLADFTIYGDMAYDIGEFLVDLRNLIETQKKGDQYNSILKHIRSSIVDLYPADNSMRQRILVAEARSWLKIAELKLRKQYQYYCNTGLKHKLEGIAKKCLKREIKNSYNSLNDAIEICM